MKWTEDKIEELRMLYESGLPMQDIAEILGTTKNGVDWARRKYQIPVRQFFLADQTKMTNEKINQAITLYQKGKSISQIARYFNVTYSLIQRKLTEMGVKKRAKSSLLNLAGRTFGFLTVKVYEKFTQKWLCECFCGNKVLRKSHDLISKSESSCGCVVISNNYPRVFTPEFLKRCLEWDSNICAYPLCENEIKINTTSGKKWHLCERHNSYRQYSFRWNKRRYQQTLEKYL